MPTSESCWIKPVFLRKLFNANVLLFVYRVLLRVRMLYYIQHEVIGDLVSQINEGVHAR